LQFVTVAELQIVFVDLRLRFSIAFIFDAWRGCIFVTCVDSCTGALIAAIAVETKNSATTATATAAINAAIVVAPAHKCMHTYLQ